MDAPAMLTRKHVPEDVGQRNIAAEEGGQQQMHRDEKPHKPVLKKVKDKMKKIKNSIAGHGHGNGNGNGDEHEHEHDTGGSNSTDMDEEDAVMREAEVETGGYQEDGEDKRVMDSGPELHGAPMYDSETIPAAAKDVKRNDTPASDTIPAAAKEVKHNDTPAVQLGGQAAAKGVERNDDTGVRLSDLGGPVVEDPAAPHSKTPTPRGGEDVGTTDVVRDFEAMVLSGAEKMDRDQVKETEAMPVSDGTGEEWTDAPTDAEYTGSYTDRLKNTAAGTTEYGKKLASTVYEKVAGAGTVVASKAQQVTPGFGAGGNAQVDSSTPEPMAVDAGKRDFDLPKEGTPASYTGTEELKNAATDATTEGAPAATYTDKIRSAAAGTTEYGKQLASTVYEKVTGAGTVVTSKAQQVTPGFGAGGNAQHDSSTPEPMAVDAGKRDFDLPREGTPASYTGTEELKNAATDATTEGPSGATYTDKIKSAAAGTTEYGKQLASSVYEKVAGVGTAVASKAQQVMPSTGTATPGVGAHDGSAAATVTPGAGGAGSRQDKGVSGVTAYIAEKLRPGDEERSLSEAITGAVQQRKEGVGSTVAKAREVPAQAVTRARDAVTSLTGGNRVSETVQPTTEGNIGGGVAEVGPTLRGEEIGAERTNTNGI